MKSGLVITIITTTTKNDINLNTKFNYKKKKRFLKYLIKISLRVRMIFRGIIKLYFVIIIHAY